MVTVTITGSAEEVHSEACQFWGIQTVTQVKYPVEIEKLQKAVEAKKETKLKETAEKLADVAMDTKETKKAETESAPAVDLVAEIKGIIPKLVKEIGRDKLVALLAEFGAKAGSEIKEGDRPKFLQKAKSLLPA